MVIITTSAVLLVFPFWGQFDYYAGQIALAAHGTKSTQLAITPTLVTAPAVAPIAVQAAMVATSTPAAQVPAVVTTGLSGNVLLIPKIGVAMAIVEGEDAKLALRKGAWRLPGTSTPDEGGTPLSAAPPGSFRPGGRTVYTL